MLQARNLSVEVGGRLVVVDASFTLLAGDKVGLVGRNGAGKTSMLKVVGGEAGAAEGHVFRKGALGYLRQDPRLHAGTVDTTSLSHIIAGRGLDHAAQRIEKLRLRIEENPSSKNVEKFARAEENYRADGGYSAEAEAYRIAHGLGLPDDRLELPIAALSGGERRRVELGRILFAGSDVLVLDEPTNHLDTDAKAWLMKFLAGYKGALLVVSHDLALLDRAITRILHLDESVIVEYRGTYSQYKESRKKDEARLGKIATRQASEIKRLSTLADSMRGQTQRRARTAKMLDSRVNRMRSDQISAPRSERSIAVRFPEPPHCGKVALTVESLTKGYGGPPVFEDVEFDLGRGERLFIMGLNGAGKTSLLRILAGQTEPDAGDIRTGVGVSMGYYAQEHEGVTPGHEVLWHMRNMSGAPDQQLRALVGMFGLSGDIAFQDAGTLSGGEKTKLALAQLVAGKHNVLLLDEPTNNLDPPSLTAIADALSRWPGAMIVVSHDVEFVKTLAPDRVLNMPEGTLDYWSNDLLDLVAMA